jgi:hypothetical protein
MAHTFKGWGIANNSKNYRLSITMRDNKAKTEGNSWLLAIFSTNTRVFLTQNARLQIFRDASPYPLYIFSIFAKASSKRLA